MKFPRTLLFLALTGASAAAISADMAGPAPASADFVKMAAQDGMTEVALGKLAMDNSQDADVKQFAERMVTDHGMANDELASLAKTKGIDAPAKLDAKHDAMVKMMAGKKGADFDAAYSKHMNMDHTKAVELFEQESKSTDADFAGFAQKTLPTLKEHKQMAMKLAAKKAM